MATAKKISEKTKISKGKVSIEIRMLIVKLKEEGKSYAEIAKLIDRPRATIQTVINNYRKNKSFESAPGRGRKKAFTMQVERKIERMVKKDPKTSAPKITALLKKDLNVTVNPQTVRNLLHRQSYAGRISRKKPFLTKRNVVKRLAYVNEFLNKSEEFWNTVVFVDESKFNIFGSDGARYVWRKTGTALDKQNITPTVKHGGGNVMVWGAMGAGGVGDLVFIETNMDKEKYLDILQNHLKRSAIKVGATENFVLVQDNDPKHASKLIKNWLIFNVKSTLPHPPQSPDLNPIENLWDLLERRLRQHEIKNKQQLKEKLLEEWNKISIEDTRKLVHSMNTRLQEVITQKGYHTHY